ncbi:MAG: LPS export ABC transporter permease LptG [Sphingopyxis sp.]
MSWYVGKMFVLRSFVILAMLALVLQTLDLLGESGKILAVPGNSNADVWRYSALRLPQIIARFLPFSVLLGTLVTLVTLNQNSEIISMKSGGLSAHQILAPLFLASLAVAGISFAFNERVVTRSTATLSAWQKAEYARVPVDSGVHSNVWVRSDDALIHATRVRGRGSLATLEGIEVFERSDARINSIVRAATATYGADGWQLTNARRYDVQTGRVEQLGAIVAGRGVPPDRFTLANVKGDSLDYFALRSAITELKAAGRPTQSLETALYHKISGPLSAVLMPLLGAVAGFGLARSGQLLIRAIIGMGLGFAYFVADNFGLSMGNLGAYPPLLAAWGPFALFLLIGELVLIRSEE